MGTISPERRLGGHVLVAAASVLIAAGGSDAPPTVPKPVPRVAATPRPGPRIPGVPSAPSPGPADRLLDLSRPPSPPAPRSDEVPPAPVAEPSQAAAPGGGPRRYLVHDDSGRAIVARLHGEGEGRVVLALPDGQLGTPTRLIETDLPFRPDTIAEVRQSLAAGPFAGFQVIQSAHYLVFYQGTQSFASCSSALLEKIYAQLSSFLRKRGVEARESEFPLVAVIFATEREFREHRPVHAEVQAYYELYTNRIYFYEKSSHDDLSPRAASLRRPQTVAHEGAHQILANIGVQARLSPWPAWLTEGLAEYCSPPMKNRKGQADWAGIGAVNGLHMSTIHDLYDRASLRAMGVDAADAARTPALPMSEHLLGRPALSPTDYALAWGLAHYLGNARADDFNGYLRAMSRLAPLSTLSEADQRAMFRAAFGDDPGKLDKSVRKHLAKLKFDPVPHYAVLFEQAVPGGMVRRGAYVSQSPAMIEQWLANMASPRGAEHRFESYSYPTRTRALQSAEVWLRGH